MKIAKVECIPVTSPLLKPFFMPNTKITGIDSLVLKIYTDEGIVGFSDSGDTSSWYRGELQDSMLGIISRVIAPQILIGENPMKIEKIAGRMDLLVRDNNQAKATVDFALHDLKGKILNTPVYELLGGRTIKASKLGWVLSAGKPETVVPEALDALKNGFSLLKLKNSGNIDGDAITAREVREAVGDDIPITVDANGFWNYHEALQAIRKMESYNVNLALVEQPVPHWDIEGMARLREVVGTPIWADESAQELHHLKEIIDRRAADGLFIKLQKAGGLLKSQRWLTMARLADMPVMCGCMIGSGLECSPAAHLFTSNQWASQFLSENLGPLTIHDCWNTTSKKITNDIAMNIPRYENGELAPNDGPGFGIDLNEEFIQRNITKGQSPRIIE
jgi:L-alanine-DL-glutamate epimerase-like enolase superfamily enzyme